MAQNNKLKILINGQVYITNLNYLSIDTLKEYILANKIKVITEYNHTIISEKRCKQSFIFSFDKIEFISIVGGG